MRSKQVNLYRNVFAGEQRKRRLIALLSVGSIAIVAPLFALLLHLRGIATEAEHSLDVVVQQSKAEKIIIDDLVDGLKKANAELSKRAPLDNGARERAQRSIVENTSGEHIISMLLALNYNASRLTSLIYKSETLTLYGEAIDRQAALLLINDVSARMTGQGWSVGKRLISSRGGKVDFEVSLSPKKEEE